jgi:hypothetical protein
MPVEGENVRRAIRVAVFSAREYSRYDRLLGALSQLYPVEFVSGRELDMESVDGALLIDVTCFEAVRTARMGVRCLAYIDEQRVLVPSARSKIVFFDSPCISKSFRGRILEDTSVDKISHLEAELGDEIVARKGEDILWMRRSKESVALDLVSMELPELAENEYLLQHFRGEDWARLLPLMHFLRELSPWKSAPLRACFMFDDPNLHWKSYGYIRYDELVEHAEAYNYHVSFATVPMDAWYVNRKAAALFREHKSRLSLLVHGNNHSHTELDQIFPNGGREALAAQALCRIRRLERVSGLAISRVMAPPHGACSHAMANVLLRMGFEAACISRGPLSGSNPDTAWPITHGLNMVGFFEDGLPLLLRIPLKKGREISVLLAAFLGQPIIAAGHHEIVADGLDLLEEWAGLINSLGAVQWMDIGSIARTNYCTHREGDVLHVQMHSRNIRLTLPEGCLHLAIHRPWLQEQHDEGLIIYSRGVACEEFNPYQGQPLRVTAGEEIAIASNYGGRIDAHKIPVARAPLWTIARRQLCEARDRLRPTMDRLLKRSRGI